MGATEPSTSARRLCRFRAERSGSLARAMPGDAPVPAARELGDALGVVGGDGAALLLLLLVVVAGSGAATAAAAGDAMSASQLLCSHTRSATCSGT